MKFFYELFESRAEAKETQDNTAVFSDKTRNITYRELNAKANQLARYLLEQCQDANSLEITVGLFFPQSIDYITCMLAIMKAGLNFISFSLNTALKRVQEYERSSKITLLLSHSILKEYLFLTSSPNRIIYLDNETAQLSKYSTENLSLSLSLDQLAYTHNTSGSTGNPKQVLINHAGLLHCANGLIECLNITAEDKVSAYCDISFDAHIAEIMMTLGAGASLFLVSHDKRLDYVDLPEYCSQHKITIATQTPSVLNILNPHHFPTLRVLLSTGEALPKSTVDTWCKANPKLVFVNGYGPAEATIATSVAIIKPGDPIHIGTALKGLTMYVLEIKPQDENAPKWVQPGEQGEIYISGAGIARGYSDLELTKKRFRVVTDPDNRLNTIRVYQTRDKGFYTLIENNTLQFFHLGRLDRELKIYGKLVGPDEIEELLRHESVIDVQVDPQKTEHGHPNFIAYLHVKEGFDLYEYYSSIARKFPSDTAPARWVLLDKSVVSDSGKNAQKNNAISANRIVRAHSHSPVKATSPIASELATLWKETLDIGEEKIDFTEDDNFFLMGGTSIQASALLVAIHNKYNVNISMSELIYLPTIASQERIIKRKLKQSKSDNTPILLNDKRAILGQNTPLFLIHSIVGNAEEDYNKLIITWPSDRPLYGITSRALRDCDEMDDNLIAIAHDYIDAMRSQQPKGPYLLGGWSSGGIIAYVMAQILNKQQEEVYLHMIDSQSLGIFKQKTRMEYAKYLHDLFSNRLVKFFHSVESPIDLNRIANLPKTKQVYLCFEEMKAQLLLNKTETIALSRLTVIKNILLGTLHYDQISKVKNAVLWAASQTQNDIGDRLLWNENEIAFNAIHKIEGNHESIFDSPALSQQLENTLKSIDEIKLSLHPITIEHKKIVIGNKNSVANIISDDYQHDQVTKATHYSQKLFEYDNLMINQPYLNQALAYYVPTIASLHLTTFNNTNNLFDAEQYVTEYLKSDHKKVLLILGQSGAGKSLFLYHLSINLWKMYKTGKSLYLPILLELKSYKNNIKSFLDVVLRERLSNHEISELEQNETQLVLLLDGYDELGLEKDINLYTENKFHIRKIKVIITCRTQYLNRKDQYRALFTPSKIDSVDFNEIHISLLLQHQIDQYLHLRAQKQKDGWSFEKYQSTLKSMPEIREIITTPLLLKLVVDTLPELYQIKSQQQDPFLCLSKSDIYGEFVNGWFTHEAARWIQSQDGISHDIDLIEEFTNFSQELAFMMFQENILEVSKNDVEIWNRFFDPKNKELSQQRAGCPLRRIEDYKYTFIHKSFMEYFVAKLLYQELIRLAITNVGKSFLNKKLLTSEPGIIEFLASLVINTKGILSNKLINKSKEIILLSQPNALGSSVSIAATNLFTLLVKAKIPIYGEDYRTIQVPKADLSYSVLDRVNLSNANLQDAIFTSSFMSGAQLTGANMSGIECSQLPHIEQELSINSIGFSYDKCEFISVTENNLSLWDTRKYDLKKIFSTKDDKMTNIAISPKHDLIAIGFIDGSLATIATSQHNINTPNYLPNQHTLIGKHDSAISCLAFSNDGKHLASGSWDKTVRIWSLNTDDCIILQGYFGLVTSISFSYNNKLLASACDNGHVYIFDRQSSNLYNIHSKKTSNSLAINFSPVTNHLAAAGWDENILLSDMDNRKLDHKFFGHTDIIQSVIHSPNGKLLASGGRDRIVKVWDILLRECLFTFWGHRDCVTSLTFYPADTYPLLLASGSDDKTIKFWLLDPNKARHTQTKAHTGPVKWVSFSTSHPMLFASASEDKTIQLWRTDTAQHYTSLYGHTDTVRMIVFSPSGKMLVSAASDNTIKLWDIHTSECLQTFTGHRDCVRTVLFSSDEKQIISGSSDCTIKVWNIHNSEVLTLSDDSMKTHVRCLALSPLDRDMLASGSVDRNLRLWSLNNNKITFSIIAHNGGIRALAFSPSMPLLVSASFDHSIIGWRIVAGTLNKQFKLTGHADPVNSLSFFRSGNYLVSSGNDNCMMIWNITNESYASNTGYRIYYPKKVDITHQYKSKKDWEIAKNVLLITGFKSPVNCVSISTNNQIVAACDDHSIKVWDFDESTLNIYLRWTTIPGLYCDNTNITDAINLSDNNKKLLLQHGSIEEKKQDEALDINRCAELSYDTIKYIHCIDNKKIKKRSKYTNEKIIKLSAVLENDNQINSSLHEKKLEFSPNTVDMTNSINEYKKNHLNLIKKWAKPKFRIPIILIAHFRDDPLIIRLQNDLHAAGLYAKAGFSDEEYKKKMCHYIENANRDDFIIIFQPSTIEEDDDYYSKITDSVNIFSFKENSNSGLNDRSKQVIPVLFNQQQLPKSLEKYSKNSITMNLGQDDKEYFKLLKNLIQTIYRIPDSNYTYHYYWESLINKISTVLNGKNVFYENNHFKFFQSPDLLQQSNSIPLIPFENTRSASSRLNPGNE